MKRVLKWTIPVDDRWHEIGGGAVTGVQASADAADVTVWTHESVEEATGLPIRTVRARVVGTGQPLDDRWFVVGSAAEQRGLVWHVVVTP